MWFSGQADYAVCGFVVGAYCSFCGLAVGADCAVCA